MGQVTGGRLAALVVVAALWGAPLAAAGEVAGPEAASQAPDPDEAREVPAADLGKIKGILRGLALAMVSGDAGALGKLLSPALPAEERERIVSTARGEFGRLNYVRFAFDLEGDLGAEYAGENKVGVLVTATYEYESRDQRRVEMAGGDTNSYKVTLENTAEGWRVLASDLFKTFSSVRPGLLMGWIFLGGFVGLVTIFFCGWMAVDAWTRFGRAWYGLLVLVTPPAGPAVYFFAVYLRDRLVRREEDA